MNMGYSSTNLFLVLLTHLQFFCVWLYWQISKSHRRANEHSRQLPTPQDTVPPAKHPQKLVQLQSVHADENYIEYTEQGHFPVASKKKKDKTKKKKQKGPSVTELVAPLPPPRGMVPPLNSLGPPGVAKFGVLDPHGIKPAPWEHGSLGPLRQAPPDPAPPTSPRMGRAGFPHSEERFDHNEGAFERPRTPEPPQRSRDLGGHQTLQPSPPDASFRGPIEGGFYDREMGYGPSGPPHGPLAHANGQALLKNMVSEDVQCLLDESGLHKNYFQKVQKCGIYNLASMYAHRDVKIAPIS